MFGEIKELFLSAKDAKSAKNAKKSKSN